MFATKTGYTYIEHRAHYPVRTASSPRPAFDYSATVAATSRFMSKWLLALLLGVYALAAFLPASVVWGGEVDFGEFRLLGESSRISLSTVFLAVLLFNAGLDIPLGKLRDLGKRPGMLLAGLAANLVVPVLYIAGVSFLLQGHPDTGAVQSLVVGLALIASMPIAGSSAAWAQTAKADMALALGLILCSTVLSPLTTPALLHAVGWLARGDFSVGLDALANSGMSIFLTLFVLAPAVLGLAVRRVAGDRLVGRVMPTLKLANTALLLLLTYTNASSALPGMVARPDWTLIGLGLAASLGMCVVAFTVGWLLANTVRADEGQRTALMFGLGLNISSPGLVLAAATLSHMPGVMLPALLYTLVQHVVAGVVTVVNRRQAEARRASSAAPTSGAFVPVRLPAAVRPSALAS